MKVKAEALLRLKRRVRRLSRLLELDAPLAVIVQESFLVMDAAQMLDPDACAARVKDRIVKEAKASMHLCEEDDCEDDIAWYPNPREAPATPFHMTMCEAHAIRVNQEMEEEEDDDGET